MSYSPDGLGTSWEGEVWNFVLTTWSLVTG